jgi:hypothetical protein
MRVNRGANEDLPTYRGPPCEAVDVPFGSLLPAREDVRIRFTLSSEGQTPAKWD